MWIYYALLSAFFAALTAIFSKLGVSGIDSSLALAIRVSFILILTWAIVLVNGSIRALPEIAPTIWFYLLLSAITTGLSWLFYFRALELGDVSRVAPLDKLSVPIAIVLAFIFLGEPLSWKVIGGGTLITIGSLILLL